MYINWTTQNLKGNRNGKLRMHKKNIFFISTASQREGVLGKPLFFIQTHVELHKTYTKYNNTQLYFILSLSLSFWIKYDPIRKHSQEKANTSCSFIRTWNFKRSRPSNNYFKLLYLKHYIRISSTYLYYFSKHSIKKRVYISFLRRAISSAFS